MNLPLRIWLCASLLGCLGLFSGIAFYFAGVVSYRTILVFWLVGAIGGAVFGGATVVTPFLSWVLAPVLWPLEFLNSSISGLAAKSSMQKAESSVRTIEITLSNEFDKLRSDQVKEIVDAISELNLSDVDVILDYQTEAEDTNGKDKEVEGGESY